MSNELSYHEKTGLSQVKYAMAHMPVGTYHRHSNGKWILRIKRKKNGDKWREVPVEKLPAKLRTTALILGIQVSK